MNTTTDQPVNLRALTEALGIGLRCVGPDDDGVTKIKWDDDTVTEQDVTAAIAAHDSTPDPPPPPAPSAADLVEALAEQLGVDVGAVREAAQAKATARRNRP